MRIRMIEAGVFFCRVADRCRPWTTLYVLRRTSLAWIQAVISGRDTVPMKFSLAHKLQWPGMHVLFKGLGFVSGFAMRLF